MRPFGVAALAVVLLSGLWNPYTSAVAGTRAGTSASADIKADNAAGEAIYRKGVLPSGQLLSATRESGATASGREVACVNCHKRSGLGAIEGSSIIPPVAASYLFHPRAGSVDDLDLPVVEGMKADRDPYTEATLARAIRQGLAQDGKPLNYLMPHFQLDDAAMADLIGYLQGLSPGKMPGTTEEVLHFATIVTPDADPKAKQGVLNVVQQFVADKNHYTRSQSAKLRSSHRYRYKVNRHWELHVWELTGPAEGWRKQLEAKLAAQPVFAVISGVGGSNWRPVHDFCEAQELPCLFPVVDLPAYEATDYDSLYFSRGVLLEADLIAHDLKAQPSSAATRVVQIFRSGDVGPDAARALAHALGGRLTVSEQRLPAGGGEQSLRAALRNLRTGDIPVLWLRPGDVAGLGAVPAGLSRAYLSGRMAGLEDAPLPTAWRPMVHMSYPFDLPDHRRVQIDYPLGWFRLRGIPVVSLQAQADAYLACTILSETINRMVDAFVGDYLVERIDDLLPHRIITGYYPRLSLATGQTFASKGGYLVHFTGPAGTKIAAEGAWLTP